MDELRPLIDDPDFRLYVGDALDVLQKLPARSADCIVTSPPYWGLRDYAAPGQLGVEASSAEYVENLTGILRAAREILTPTGTLWLNLGDSYEDKDLAGIPWRVALALQEDGWFLRADVIWSKPNPMPESVTDRPTRAHEYVFMLASQPRYFFDQEAVREDFVTDRMPGSRIRETERYGAGNGGNAGLTDQLSEVKDRLRAARRPQEETLDGSEGEAPRGPDGRRQTRVEGRDGSAQHRDGDRWPNEGRNIRTVWEIPTGQYQDAHFAVFPEELPRRCIAAGCPEGGTVLDPFLGSGTTALVARKLGRRSVGIELNPEYAALAATRLQQLSLLA